MNTTVGFTYTHLATEYSVTATFTREDAPRLAMHSETGAEGEWQFDDISVEDEDGECWYMEMSLVDVMVDSEMVNLARLILDKAFGEIE